MELIVRQAGEPWVISSTYAVAAEFLKGEAELADVPVFRILPGRYITALPASSTVGSIVAQVWVLIFSARVGIGNSYDPVFSTRPSGSTKMWG